MISQRQGSKSSGLMGKTLDEENPSRWKGHVASTKRLSVWDRTAAAPRKPEIRGELLPLLPIHEGPVSPGRLHEAGEPKGATVLKGHGFSRADCELLKVPALAAEGCISAISNLPPGAKAQDSLAPLRHPSTSSGQATSRALSKQLFR